MLSYYFHSSGSQYWLYIRITLGAFKNPNIQATIKLESLAMWSICVCMYVCYFLTSPRAISTFSQVEKYYFFTVSHYIWHILKRCVIIQFSQNYFLKRLSFPHWVFLAPLSNVSWPYMWEFISGLSILFHLSMCLFLCHYNTVLMTVAL